MVESHQRARSSSWSGGLTTPSGLPASPRVCTADCGAHPLSLSTLLFWWCEAIAWTFLWVQASCNFGSLGLLTLKVPAALHWPSAWDSWFHSTGLSRVLWYVSLRISVWRARSVLGIGLTWSIEEVTMPPYPRYIQITLWAYAGNREKPTGHQEWPTSPRLSGA